MFKNAARITALAVALLAVGYHLAMPTAVQANPPKAKVTIYKQKVNANTMKVKLKIVAEAPGIAKNTFQTEWITLPRYNPRPLPPMNLGVFRLTGMLRWTGNAVVAQVHVHVGVLGANFKQTFTASVAAS